MTDFQMILYIAAVLMTQGIERGIALKEAVALYKDAQAWYDKDVFGFDVKQWGKFRR